MKRLNTKLTAVRATGLVVVACLLEAVVLYGVLSLILPQRTTLPEAMRTVPVPGVSVADSLDTGEALVPADALVAQSSPEQSRVTPLELVVTVKASVTDESGAQVTLSAVAKPCGQAKAQIAGSQQLSIQNNKTSLNLGMSKTVCIQAIPSAEGQPFLLADNKERWTAREAYELPELDTMTQSLDYVDISGRARRLTLSAIGYCESAGEGCSATISLSERGSSESPTSQIYSTAGVVPLWLSDGLD